MAMTKKEMFETLLTFDEVKANSEIVEKINHEITLLNNRNASGSKKPTKNQQENDVFIEDIIATLSASDKALTISEIIANTASLSAFRDDDGNPISNQRVNQILRKEVRPTDSEPEKGNPDGRIVKTYIKRKAYFTAYSAD